MKEKFIEWFTAGNSGYAPAVDADGKFEKEKTQHMWEAYQAGLASAEAQVKQLAAENAALKDFISTQCFVYDSKGHEGDAEEAMPGAPATDAILASLRAEGVEMAFEAAQPEVAKESQRETFDQCVTAAVKYPQSDVAGKVEMVAWLEWFAAQLRSKSEVQHD